jgi:hypothetical protein
MKKLWLALALCWPLGPASAQTNIPGVAGKSPTGMVAVAQGSTGTTGIVTATLGAAANLTTYICGFSVSANIISTGTPGPVTIVGLLGGTQTILLPIGSQNVSYSRDYSLCIPASAPNTVITVNSTACSGCSAVDVNAHGYQY